MEGLRGLNSALVSFHARHENSRMLRTSWSIFRCFLFFDVCYLLSGVALMILAITDAESVAGTVTDKFSMIVSGAGLGMFATLSALCNSLGCHGLRHWRRVFLLPWLTFYLLVLGLVTTLLLSALHSNNFLMQWRHVFLFFAVFTIFYCWSHVKRQFIMMALPRPDEVSRHDVESLVRDIMRQRPGAGPPPQFVTSSPEADLPPKYEELGVDLPPEYDENTMSADPNPSPQEPSATQAARPNCDTNDCHDNHDEAECPSNSRNSHTGSSETKTTEECSTSASQ